MQSLVGHKLGYYTLNRAKGFNVLWEFHKFYREHKHYVDPNAINMTGKSNEGPLQYRWATIQEFVNKFCGFYGNCKIGIKVTLASIAMKSWLHVISSIY